MWTLWLKLALASGESEEAELSFQLGLEAYTHGQYNLALSRFLTSNRLAPNPAVAFNIARCYARTGRYAEAYRWYRLAREGLTDQATLRAVEEGLAAITPQVVVYELTSQPQGALVYVDSRDLGTVGATPLTLALLPREEPRRFIFERPGYETAVITDSQGVKGQTVALTGELRQIVGKVSVSGTEGAEVRAGTPDGPLLCVTPCAAEVEPGARVLYVRRQGYRDAVLQVQVQPDKPSELVVQLQPDTGTVVVDASEPGALVEIDGRAVGFTPVVVPAVPVGSRTLRVSRPGFTPVERAIEVSTDQQVDVTGLQLVPLSEVSAVSRRSESLALAPSSVSVLTRDELRAFRYPTLYEALRGVRGVSLTHDGIYSAAAVRGLGQANDYGNRLLILSDGATLNDNILYQSFIGYDGRVDLAGIDRIEVVRGPGSVLYGTGAVSGVVNLVGELPEEGSRATVSASTFEETVQGSAQAQLSREEMGLRASVSAAASPGHGQRLDLRGGRPSLEVRGFDQFEGATTSGRAWLGQATLQWFHTWRTVHVPTGPYGTRFNEPLHRWIDTRSLAELRYEPQLSERVRLLTRVYGNRYTYEAYYPYRTFLSYELFQGVSAGAEARAIASLGEPVQLQAGAQVEHSPIVEIEGEDRVAGEPADPYLDESQPYTILAAYAVADIVPVEALRVTLGSRIDQWSTFGSALSPRAAVIVLPSDTDVIKLMAGRAFRAPSVYELLYNSPGYQVRPDHDGTVLRPEAVWSGELEYSHTFGQVWTGLLAAHASRATDLIETVLAPDAGAGVITYRNSDQPIRILGADLELRRAFQGGLLFSAFYSVLDSSYADGQLVPNAPRHNAALKVVLPTARTSRLAARLSLEGPRRIDLTDAEMTEVAVVGDVVLSGSLAPLGFDYALGIYNVLDMDYAQPVTDNFPFRTVPQRGRSLLVSLSKRF
jgi:outer membrane receptor for ferrienterochelin and colicins